MRAGAPPPAGRWWAVAGTGADRWSRTAGAWSPATSIRSSMGAAASAGPDTDSIIITPARMPISLDLRPVRAQCPARAGRDGAGRRNFPSRRGVAIQSPGVPRAARSASNGCAQAQGGSRIKLGTLVIGVALLLGTAGPGFAGTVNCKQVNKYLGTGRSVSDVAQTMVIDEADVKKCQEEAAKGTAGGAKDAAKPAAEAPSKDMPK